MTCTCAHPLAFHPSANACTLCPCQRWVPALTPEQRAAWRKVLGWGGAMDVDEAQVVEFARNMIITFG